MASDSSWIFSRVVGDFPGVSQRRRQRSNFPPTFQLLTPSAPLFENAFDPPVGKRVDLKLKNPPNALRLPAIFRNHNEP